MNPGFPFAGLCSRLWYYYAMRSCHVRAGHLDASRPPDYVCNVPHLVVVESCGGARVLQHLQQWSITVTGDTSEWPVIWLCPWSAKLRSEPLEDAEFGADFRQPDFREVRSKVRQ